LAFQNVQGEDEFSLEINEEVSCETECNIEYLENIAELEIEEADEIKAECLVERCKDNTVEFEEDIP